MDKWLENEYVSWNLDACIYSGQDERRPYDPKFREDMILDLVWWINKICVAIYDFFLIASKGHFWKVKNFLSFSIFTLSLGLVLKFRTYMDQSLIFWPKTQFSLFLLWANATQNLSLLCLQNIDLLRETFFFYHQEIILLLSL